MSFREEIDGPVAQISNTFIRRATTILGCMPLFMALIVDAFEELYKNWIKLNW